MCREFQSTLSYKRSSSDEIRLSMFNFLNLLDSAGLKYVYIGEERTSIQKSRDLKSFVLKWVKQG